MTFSFSVLPNSAKSKLQLTVLTKGRKGQTYQNLYKETSWGDRTQVQLKLWFDFSPIIILCQNIVISLELITEHLMDFRLVYKLEFVRCGPVEKSIALYLCLLNRGGPSKFENTFSPIAKLRFSTILALTKLTWRFLWFSDELSCSRYLGWSVAFNTNFKTSNLCLKDQAYNCVIHFSSLLCIIH